MKRNYYKKQDVQYTLYLENTKNNDLELLTFFDNVEDVANYLEVGKNSVFKIINGERKTFQEKVIKVYDKIIGDYIDKTIKTEIKIIKDIF